MRRYGGQSTQKVVKCVKIRVYTAENKYYFILVNDYWKGKTIWNILISRNLSMCAVTMALGRLPFSVPSFAGKPVRTAILI